MRSMLVAALVLVACDKGAKKAPPAPQSPPAPGILRGNVDATFSGPGQETNPPSQEFTEHRRCTVTITPSSEAHRPPSTTPSRDELEHPSHTVKVTTNDKGDFETSLPPGPYEVSYAGCGATCVEDPDVHVDVHAGSATVLESKGCESFAK